MKFSERVALLEKRIVEKWFNVSGSGMPSGVYRETNTDEALVELDKGQLSTFIQGIRDSSRDRATKFYELDQMSQDGIIGSAIELIADDATQPDSQKDRIVWVSADNTEIEKALNKFLDLIDMDSRIWTYAYHLVKYGEVFIRTHFSSVSDYPELKDRVGFLYEVVQNPTNFLSVLHFGDVIGFIELEDATIKGVSGAGTKTAIYNEGKVKMYPVQDFIHIINDKANIRNNIEIEIEKDKPKKVFQVRQGSSCIENARVDWKVLDLLETLMVYVRFGRSSVYRIFNIEVGNASRSETARIVKELKTRITQQESMDLDAGTYAGIKKPVPHGDAIFIPKRGEKGAVDIQLVGGDYEIKDAIDLDHYLGKVFGALKIPKAYLGFEECLFYDTKVKLLDGTTHLIGDMAKNPELFIGKQVLSCSAEGKAEPTEIVHVKKTRLSAEFVRVYIDNNTHVDATPDHPFMMSDYSYKNAGLLSSGDLLSSSSSKSHRVVKVEKLDIVEDAYDLGVASENHNFLLANGIFVHNSLPGGIGNQSLTRMDIRYARTVKRVVNLLKSGVKDIIEFYCRAKGYDEMIGQFDVRMTKITSAEDTDKKDEITTDISVAESLRDLFMDSDYIDKEKLTHKLVSLMGDFFDSDIVKKSEEGDEDGSMGSGGGGAGRGSLDKSFPQRVAGERKSAESLPTSADTSGE